MLTIRLLGGLEVSRGAGALALPPSRRTRALLAYLVATRRPHRRERLCSLFWGVPDDPRGALRWSLSKLRALVDEPGAPRLVADRESVAFVGRGDEVDLDALRDLTAAGAPPDAVPTERLRLVAGAARGDFLEGLDLPGQADFQAWCVAEREEARRRHAAVLGALVARLAAVPEEALPHARRAVQLEPFDERARAALVGLLASAGRRGEAEQHCEAGLRLLREAGLPSGELTRLARDLRDPGFARRGRGTPPPGPGGARRPSVAVLPFANLSGDPEQGYFADGIADDLVTDLAKVSGLFVAARQSAFALKGAALDAREAGARLGARYVLEGGVRRAGERVRITAQLVDAATGGHLWAERYDRVLTDVFAVQDEIARRIVAALKVRLLPAEAEAIHRAPTADLEAYQLYLRGRHLFRRRTEHAYGLARRLFAQAVALDPGFARAHAGVAQCDANLHLHHGGSQPVEGFLAAAEAALALEPGLAAAHAARGVALVASGRLAEAGRELERAIALEPDDDDAHQRYARVCFQQGRMEDAARLFRRAAELNPDDIFAANTLLGIERGLGQHEAARATARLLLERARRELERHPEYPYAAFAAASALATLGDREGAARLAGRALALEPDDHPVQYNVACVHAALGEAERAIDLLERAMPGASAHRWAWLARDPDLDALRGHPRFEALLLRRGAGT